jgi:hypothetical protein
MQANLVVFASWLNSDSKSIKLLLIGATLVLALSGLTAGIASAGPMPDGPDIPRP